MIKNLLALLSGAKKSNQEMDLLLGNRNDGGIFGYIKYALIAVTLAQMTKQFFGQPDVDNVPGVQVEMDYQVKQVLANYYASLQVQPSTEDSFVFHEKPASMTRNITIESEVDGARINTTHEVPTLEGHIYNNTLNPPQMAAPLWDNEELLDISLFLSEYKDNYSLPAVISAQQVSVLNISSIHKSLQYPLTPTLKNNGTLYLHIVMKNGNETAHTVSVLTSYSTKKKQVVLKKLLSDDNDDATVVDDTEDKIVAYWHPNVTINICQTPGFISLDGLPAPLTSIIQFDESGMRDNSTGLVGRYYPFATNNRFWQLQAHMDEVSELDNLEINLSLDIIPWWKFQMYTMANDAINQMSQGGLQADQFDAIKKILIETNPYLLAITVAVSLLHSLLEFLAFKNDISHWRNKKDNVGVSVRSIIANVIMQIITLLYLLDNAEGTSYMILATQGAGILVEAWKITTMVDIKLENGRVHIRDKHVLSDTEKATQEADAEAFKYLYWASIPLVFGYAVYALIYQEHKSWYSFVIATLVGCVYTYGFLMLVPAVYINYKLKSVAHIPKKAMAYKVVNTFIDDLFAFVIKMPWLHRLATLRDDVIFVIYLYQTWIYRVDYNRVNEFGQVTEDTEKKDQ